MWIPFAIFFLGYFLTWRKSQLDKKKEVTIYRDMFINWIALAKNRTIEQSKNCITFSENIKESEFIDGTYFLVAPLMYGKLNSINLDKVISAFVFNSSGHQNENLKNFNSMIANINYLDKIESELTIKYEKSIQDLSQLNEKYNNCFIKIESIFLKKINEIGDEIGHKDSKAIKILGDFRQNWEKTAVLKENGISAIHTFEKLIQPSIEFVLPAFNKDRGNKFLLEIYDELTNMQLIKRQWFVYKTGHSELFKNYGKYIEDSYNDLDKVLKHFQFNKTVSFWKIR